MCFWEASDADGDGEMTPDPAESWEFPEDEDLFFGQPIPDVEEDPKPAWWRSPSAPYFRDSGVPLPEIEPDPKPRRLPENRRMRRDFAHGRSYFQRCRHRGFALPWYGDWPPVRVWDVVPFLRMRRARNEQAMRWAAGVTVVSLESGDDVWTVTLPDQGEGPLSRGERRGHCKNRRALFHQRVGWTHRERQAAASCLALLARKHVSTQPTNAP